MTVITRRPENRLAKVVFLPGGKTIAQALEEAQANLDDIRAESLDLLRAKLEEIQAIGRKAKTAPVAADLATLYALSGEVLDIAGLFGLPELGQAAFSLCELLDRLKSRKVWNWPAVQVHLQGLLVLADPDKIPPDGRQTVVDGLRQVCQRAAR
ncbi:MAG: chemotaxis protein CheE [Caulobacteraceae bacterium]